METTAGIANEIRTESRSGRATRVSADILCDGSASAATGAGGSAVKVQGRSNHQNGPERGLAHLTGSAANNARRSSHVPARGLPLHRRRLRRGPNP